MKYLRAWISFLLAGIILYTTSSFLAQEEDNEIELEKWYFATLWIGHGPLVAFTVDGDAAILIEEEIDSGRVDSWRYDQQSGLALISINGEEGLYHLTPQEAILLQRPPQIDDADGVSHFIRIANSGPYVVIATDPTSPAAPAMLINLETNNINLLNGNVSKFWPAPAFSEDGKYLRYISWNPEEYENYRDAPWTIWERDLISGEEQAAHNVTDAYGSIAAGHYGENWLYRINDHDAELITYTVYHPDGSSEVFAEIETVDNRPAVVYNIYKNHMFAFDPQCETDCQVTFSPLNGGDSLTVTVPEFEYPFRPQSLVEDSHLIALVNRGLWFLGKDGTSELIGFWVLNQVFSEEIISPDGRFVLAINSPDNDANKFLVWDSQTQSLVVEGEMQVGALITYFDHGFLASNGGMRNFAYYNYADDTLLWLPEVEAGGRYVDVLPDGRLLYLQHGTSEQREIGVYVYDPNTDTYTFISEHSNLILSEQAQN
jgi:hypothetical protein